MRKIREILRLKFEAGLSERRIAHSVSLARSTVGEYISRAAVCGLAWPLPASLDDAALERLLFPPAVLLTPSERTRPDWALIHQELKKKGVTLDLVWREYNSADPEGYQYSQFCELYRRWRGRLDLWMRQDHRAGEKMFVDYAGQTVEVVDPATGEIHPAQVFVAVLGASNYTFAEATKSQGLEDWIASHQRAFRFFGGVPEVVVPDNLRSGVSKACRYEPDINPTYQAMAAHYQTAVLPARVRKPKDKAKVEVQLVERWILAALRHRTFFSLPELNQAIAELLDRLNNRPFKKLPGCRRSLFAQLDQPALRPLPGQPFEFVLWSKPKVSIDYHVDVAGHYYSVPHHLVGQVVEARATQGVVEVFHHGQRVASHTRKDKKGRHSTMKEHMPLAHQAYVEWTPERLASWAGKVGPATQELARQIMAARRHPQQGFRSVLGVLRLAKTYGEERLETACRRALEIKAIGYPHVENILKNGLDKKSFTSSAQPPLPLEHCNLRGPRYYAN